MGIQDKGRLFKGLAVLIVFGFSVLMPILISNELRKSGMNLLIRQDLETISNWGFLYKVNKGDYKGLELFSEIVKKKKDIQDKGGSVEIFVSKDGEKYCAKVMIFSKDLWCIDSHGYSGKITNNCYSESFYCK
ncbi:MAG: hypothetical protein WC303_03655 [Candidatus Paceibacterota bacterium]|jgi:hypothetical protein